MPGDIAAAGRINETVDRCMQLFGGYGYCEAYPIARAWRDIRETRIFAGDNEIMKMIAARFMGCRKKYFTPHRRKVD